MCWFSSKSFSSFPLRQCSLILALMLFPILKPGMTLWLAFQSPVVPTQFTANDATKEIFIKRISYCIITELKILQWSIVFQTQDSSDTSQSSRCLIFQSVACQGPSTTKQLAAPGVHSASLTTVLCRNSSLCQESPVFFSSPASYPYHSCLFF